MSVNWLMKISDGVVKVTDCWATGNGRPGKDTDMGGVDSTLSHRGSESEVGMVRLCVLGLTLRGC
jgi:hypothetical protein